MAGIYGTDGPRLRALGKECGIVATVLGITSSCAASDVSPEHQAKVLGDVISYSGYILRTTSICEDEARFDLVRQPD